MKTMLAAVALTLALALAAGASAATPIYWAPAKMAKALTALQWPHPGTLGGTCKGVGKPRHGAYTGFRCVMTWQVTGTNGASTTSGKATAYARPMLKGRVCGSTVSLKACQPLAAGPLPGDPRVCTANDPARCAEAAAKAAVIAKHGTQVNLACTQGATVYVWSCTASGGTYQVSFAKGVSAWIATVTP